MDKLNWNKCFICNKQLKRITLSHLKKHNINGKYEYLIKFRSDLNFCKKEILYELYYNKKMSINAIAKKYSKIYNINWGFLKNEIIKIFKYYKLKTRTNSEAQKEIFKKQDVWNKNENKYNNKSVLKYTKSREKLYKKVKEVRENLNLDELIKYIGCRDIYRLLKNKLLKRQNNLCGLCEKNLEKYPKNKIDIHHIDRNNYNNNKENMIILCRKCHARISLSKYRIKHIYNKFIDYDSFLLNKKILLEYFNKRKNRKRLNRRNGAIKRDKCICCNKIEKLHIHHLDFNPENDDENNLVILCISCHNRVTNAYFKTNKAQELIKFLNIFLPYKLSEKQRKKTCKIQSNLKEFVKLHQK